MNKILSIVYANTYGSMIEIFGVSDNDKDLKKIYKTAQKNGYHAEITEVVLNKYCRRYIGGHCE